MIHSDGPDHAKTFLIEVRMNGASLAKAKGGSKKEAEQNAARLALDVMLTAGANTAGASVAMASNLTVESDTHSVTDSVTHFETASKLH